MGFKTTNNWQGNVVYSTLPAVLELDLAVLVKSAFILSTPPQAKHNT